MYADDTAFSATSSTGDGNIRKLNNHLHLPHKRTKTWKVQISANSTRVHYSRKQKHKPNIRRHSGGLGPPIPRHPSGLKPHFGRPPRLVPPNARQHASASPHSRTVRGRTRQSRGQLSFTAMKYSPAGKNDTGPIRDFPKQVYSASAKCK
jgi:hypothetical protein